MNARARNSVATLRDLIQASGIGAEARVLTVGRAGAAARNQIGAILEGFDGERFAADDDDAAGEAGVTPVAGDPFNVPLPDGIALCFVTLSLARLPDAFEELLYDRLADAVAPGGIVALHFCRDASDAALDRMKVSHPATRAALGDFLQAQFATRTVEGTDPIAAKFANDGAFAFLGWASRSNRPPGEEPIVWLVLRRRADAAMKTRALPRTRRADRFPLDQFRDFLLTLRGADVALLPVDAFAQEAAAYFATPSAQPPPKPFGHIKLDLHRQIYRPLEVASTLGQAGVPGLFLMMPRHPFNEGFFDAPKTWEILRAIEGEGHEIGLHLDVFNVIRNHGDLYRGLEILLEDFRRRGFEFRAATLHGDTRAHVIARGLRRLDFFAEDQPISRWDGKPPQGEEYLVDHIGRYSYGELATKFGIKYLSERVFRVDGKLLHDNSLLYASDNARALQILGVPDAQGAFEELTCPEKFRLPAAFTEQAIAKLKEGPFVALFHPQWFW